MDDVGFMEMALALAAKGRGFTSPNPMVGAVVVRGAKVVGQGYHRRAGGPHAEVEAMDMAGDAARGATLYVTLEPCNHFGRTPPCTEKILSAGIGRVVVATADPNPNVLGGGAALLQQRGIPVTTGVCARQAADLNRFFFKFVTTGRPYVIAKCAATLDGRIATRTGDSRWVTGVSARGYVHRLRHAVDAIMVGIGTVLADDPRLTARIPGERTLDPVRIVLDSHLRISEKARLFHLDSNAGTLIVCTGAASAAARGRIEAAGATVVCAGGCDRGIDLQHLIQVLGQMKITSLLVEGGSRVLASAFRDGIVDRCVFFYAPKILGGDDGIPVCSGPGPDRMDDCVKLTGVDVRRLGDDILVKGDVVRPALG